MDATAANGRPGTIAIVAAAAALALCAELLPAVGPANAEPDEGGERVPVLVGLDPTVDRGQAARDFEREYDARTRFIYEHAFAGIAIEVPRAARERLERDRRVRFVEDDQEVTTFDAALPTGVDRIEADQNDTASIDGTDERVEVGVAILDTGIAEHADLDIAGGADCTTGPWWSEECDGDDYDDGNGHGTHVAGSAAAIDSGEGVVGVAPGADLWAVKVLDDNGSGSISQVVAGIDWVTERSDDIDVANMSFGCECSSDALDEAIDASTDAGLVYVAAAGNDSSDARDFSPANHLRTVAVSAIADYDGQAGGAADPSCGDFGGDDTFASFSNYGAVVDLAAPGVCIFSTVPGGGYDVYSGTSMAAPHVAGAAALYVVEHGVAGDSSRWQVVRDGLVADWSVPQGDECGFGGGVSDEPLLLLADCEPADPGDDDGGDGGSEPIELAVEGYKHRGLHKADLEWRGADGDEVRIFRDGSLVATVANDGAHTDHINQRGSRSYTYELCETGSDAACSEPVTVDI